MIVGGDPKIRQHAHSRRKPVVPLDDPTADATVDDPPLNRICRHCSVQDNSSGKFCPNCGKPFEKAKPAVQNLLWIGLAVVVLAALAIGVVFVFQQSAAKQLAEDTLASQNAAAASAAASSSAAASAVQVEAAAAASAAAASEDTERALRKLYVLELESSIEKDAKARVKKDTLTGPIKRVSCTPTGGGSLDDLTSLTTTFECIAVNKKNKDKTESGYVFTATMDWDDTSYSWRLGR